MSGHRWAGSHNGSHDRIRVSEAPWQIQSFTLKSAAAISPRLDRSSEVFSIGRLNRLAPQRRSTRADLSAATSRRRVTSCSAIQLSSCRPMTFRPGIAKSRTTRSGTTSDAFMTASWPSAGRLVTAESSVVGVLCSREPSQCATERNRPGSRANQRLTGG
jgi:hypothetical protein